MITNRSNYTRLKENLEYLNLKQFNLRLDEIIELTQNRTMSVIDILLKLTDYEVDVKKQNVKESMIKVANFPYNRSLDNFDFLFNSDINELEIRNLASLNSIYLTYLLEVGTFCNNYLLMLSTHHVFQIQ